MHLLAFSRWPASRSELDEGLGTGKGYSCLAKNVVLMQRDAHGGCE